MAQGMNYSCDCGHPACEASDSINDHATPVVLYLVAGHVNGGGEIDPATLPPFVARMLKMPIARIDMHAKCAPHVLRRLLEEERPADVLE